MHKHFTVFLSLAIVLSLSAPALAVDNYHFTNAATDDFYICELGNEQSIIMPELDAGYGLPGEVTRNAPGQRDVASNLPHGRDGVVSPTFYFPAEIAVNPQYSVTPIADVRKSDGSIGVLKIPKIDLTVIAFDGDTFEAMKKGVGHIASSSYWN